MQIGGSINSFGNRGALFQNTLPTYPALANTSSSCVTMSLALANMTMVQQTGQSSFILTLFLLIPTLKGSQRTPSPIEYSKVSTE